jgi:hypothetical protein
LPAKEPVHPLQDHVGEVLDLDRRRSLDAEHQRGGLRRLVALGALPLQLDRFGVCRDLRPDDGLPAGHQLSRGEALLLERRGQKSGCEFGE